MKPISGKRLCRILEKNGWTLKRINGSHHIYGKDGTSVRATVPVHGGKPLKLGLQRHLMKVADIDESDL